MNILNTLLEITVYSAVIFVAIWLFRILLKKHLSSVMMYAMWFLLIARLLLPVTISAGFSLFVVPPAETTDVPSQSADISVQHSGETMDDYAFEQNGIFSDADETALSREQAAADTTSAQLPQRDSHLRITWETVLTAIWIAGIAVMLTAVGVSKIKLSRRLKAANPIPKEWQRLADEVKGQLSIRHNIRIVMIQGFPSPALTAGIKPTVVLPKELLLKSKENVRFALLHEMTHIKRRDNLVSLMLLVLRAIYWFNPIVWLTVKQMHLDMESACDSTLTNPMSVQTKKRYAGTMLSMYADKQMRYVLGMATGQTKKTAEKRLRSIFMRSRTSRKGRAAVLLLACVMLLACFTTACQPTPEAPVVVQKDALEESIDTLPEQEEGFSVPESWQDEIVQDSTGNTVTIDADVVCPSFDSLDIMKVRPKNFTQDEVDAFIQYFVGDAALFNGEFVETKDFLDEQIIELQQIKAMTPEEREAVCGYTEEELQQLLEELQAKYAAAPDEAPVTAVSSELTTDEDGFELLDVYAYNGGDDDALIEVFNLAEESSSASFYIRLRGQSAGGKLLSYSGEPEEIAEEILKDFNLDDVRLTRVSQAAASNEPGNNKTVTRLFYETTLKDIPIRSACSLIDEDQREYAASMLRPDQIGFDVGDNGLTSFSWRQHSEIGETVKENVAVLPFEDIMKKFEEYIFMQPVWNYGEYEKEAEPDKFVISSIELCMVAVPQKDAQGDYLLVPAWNFYGYNDYTIPEELLDYPKEQLEAMGLGDPKQQTTCLMTLSAVDGSLIHR